MKILILFLISFNLFAASTEKLNLIDELDLVNETATGSYKNTALHQLNFKGVLTTDNYVSGTVTATIQHSPDASNWETLAQFTSLTATGISTTDITAYVMPFVRAIVANTATDSDVKVDLLYDRYK